MAKLSKRDRNELGELRFRRVVKFLFDCPSHLSTTSFEALRYFWREHEPVLGLHVRCVDSGWPQLDVSLPDPEPGEPHVLEVVSTYEVLAVDAAYALELWESDGPVAEAPIRVAWESAFYQLAAALPSMGCEE